MAFGSTCKWDVRIAGSDSNGGGFATLITNMATDLAILQTTGASAISSCSSASYSALARDISHWVYVGAGTNWIFGWYSIASICASTAAIAAGGTGYAVNDILTLSGGTFAAVGKFKVSTESGGAVTAVTLDTLGAYSVLPTNAVATTGAGSGCTLNVSWGFNLTATIGSAILSNQGSMSTAQGCCTAIAPGSNGTWSIDYSQGTPIAFTDLVIGAVTNTDMTSALLPMGKNFIGNIFNVTSGTGFTVQRVQVVSIPSGVIARVDKSLGTLSSTGGNATAGGPLATPGLAGGLKTGQNKVFILNAGGATPDVYVMSITDNVSGGCVNDTADGTVGDPSLWTGWETHRLVNNLDANWPIAKVDANGTTAFRTLSGTGSNTLFRCLAAANNGAFTGCTGFNITSLNSKGEHLKASGVNIGLGLTSGVARHIYVDACGTGVVASSIKVLSDFVVTNSTSGGVTCNTGVLERGIVTNSAGPNIALTSHLAILRDITVYGATGANGDGVRFASGVAGILMTNVLSYGNAQRNFNDQTSGNSLTSRLVNCASGGGGVVDNVVAPQLEGFITLTSDPFVNAAGGDFSIDLEVGAGAALRAAGFPGAILGLSTTSYPDVGAVQSSSAASNAGAVTIVQVNIVAGSCRSVSY